METIFRLKATDLNLDFLKAIKSLFKNDNEIEVQITSHSDFGIYKSETQTECNERIEQSYANLKKKRNIVSFTGEEFEALTKKLIKK